MRGGPLLFLTRPGCGLCDEALPVIEQAARWLRVELVIVDIAAEPDLEADYDLRIPVLLNDEQKVLAEGRIGRRQAWLSAIRARF